MSLHFISDLTYLHKKILEKRIQLRYHFSRLTFHTREVLNQLGSSMAQNIKFRDVWVFVGQKGIDGFTNMEKVFSFYLLCYSGNHKKDCMNYEYHWFYLYQEIKQPMPRAASWALLVSHSFESPRSLHNLQPNATKVRSLQHMNNFD